MIVKATNNFVTQ